MKLWVPVEVRSEIEKEASDKYPLETGGVLLGYRTGQDFVLTRASGPGPLARHKRLRFRPDHEYQERWIAKRYRQTSGVETYLGDWHTHPDAQLAAPSFVDRAMAKRVAQSKAARAPNPLIMIFAGDRTFWSCRAWQAQLVPLLGIYDHCRLDQLQISLFSEELAYPS